MRHVVCLIHKDHLTIQRNGIEIGRVMERDGQPTIEMVINLGPVSLTQNDCEIIWDNWNTMLELSGAIDKVVDILPETGTVSV